MQAKTATVNKSILRMSSLWYTGTSLGIVALFLALTQIVGGYPKAAIVGGAIWSFILSMIVTMPLYTAFFKRRFAE
jgi:hypothetical protein